MRIDTSIQDFLKKINSHLLFHFPLREAVAFFLFSSLLLISVLVYIFATQGERHHFVYIPHEGEIEEEGAQSRGKGLYMGSKTGKVYYPVWCKGGSRIKESSRMYFANESAAKEGGRTLSKLCE